MAKAGSGEAATTFFAQTVSDHEAGTTRMTKMPRGKQYPTRKQATRESVGGGRAAPEGFTRYIATLDVRNASASKSISAQDVADYVTFSCDGDTGLTMDDIHPELNVVCSNIERA